MIDREIEQEIQCDHCNRKAILKAINVSDIFWFCSEGHVTTKSRQIWIKNG